MVQAPHKNKQLLSDYQTLQEKSVGWISEIRNAAMDTFGEIGLPTARKGNEKWKYTNVAPIARIEYKLSKPSIVSLDQIKASAPWDDSWLNFVFVNGVLRSDLIPPDVNGVSVFSIAEEVSLDEPCSTIINYLGSVTDVADEGFAALNTSFLSDGIAIAIAPEIQSDLPLNIIFFDDGTTNSISHPRVLIVAKPNSAVSVIESYVGGGTTGTLTNSVSEIIVGEGASVSHYRLLAETDETYDIGYGRVKLGSKAKFKSRSFFRGAKIGRYDLNVLIDGDGATCDLKGLYFTSGSQHMDNFINIDHAKPNGTSDLFYKGILDGRSRAVFGGTVLVRKSAQKTDSIQSDKNLLLSPHAEVDSKPALFIYADDVKCAHGATAGSIGADTIFYMRSRGMDLETASKLLIYGFAVEIIDAVEIDILKDFLEDMFLTALPSHEFEF